MARSVTAGELRRERAGRYRSADGRFAVERAAGAWYLTDDARRDELGQPVVLGPYASLAEASDAMSAAPSASKRPRRKASRGA